MKKGLMTFDKVMQDRKRAKRIANRKKHPKAVNKFQWVVVPEKKSFWKKIKSLFGK